MHSFHHSRGRILFEVFCALAISVSCVGAWMDLGTPAFLPAAAVSALYGLVHLFDMRGRRSAVAAAVADVAVVDEKQGDLPDFVPARQIEPVVEDRPEIAGLVEAEPGAAAPNEETELETAEPVAKKPSRGRRKRSVKAEPDIAAITEPADEAEPVQEAGPITEAEPAEPVAAEEPEHAPVTPLFEPEPFVRMPRPQFGRKAG